MTRLKLIDELLIELRSRSPVLSFHQLAKRSSVVREALNRLKKAWNSGEMEEITLSLCTYFAEKGAKSDD